MPRLGEAEVADGPPVHLWVEHLQTLTDAVRGFCKDLEIARDDVLNQLRLAKSCLAILVIPDDPPNAIRNMLDIETGRLSQGDRLAKETITDERIEGTLFGDVYASTEFFFQVEQQSSRKPRRGCAVRLR
jgi:hypothetical protein